MKHNGLDIPQSHIATSPAAKPPLTRRWLQWARMHSAGGAAALPHAGAGARHAAAGVLRATAAILLG